MGDVVIKIVLKKEAKVFSCKEMMDWISKSENVESIEIQMDGINNIHNVGTFDLGYEFIH